MVLDPADEVGEGAAVGQMADSGNFDDFSSDIIGAEVSEAAADEVWDDLDS